MLEQLRDVSRRVHGAHWGRILDGAIRAGVLITLAGVVAVANEQRAINECLSRFSEESAQTTVARSAIAAQDRELDATEKRALDAVLFAADAADRKALTQALRTYRETRTMADAQRAENEQARRENPVPGPPELRCD